MTTSKPDISSGNGNQLSLSKIVLYSMVGAIIFVLIVIFILVIFLCKRRKRRQEQKGPSMELEILDDDEKEEDKTTLLCGRSKKKKTPSPENLPIPSAPPYEPGTLMEGVYERVSSADIETKYDDVCFLHKPVEKVETQNTYVTIGRSNSFNPRKEKPVVKKTRDESNRSVNRNESIKLIETGIAPSETCDVRARLLEISQTEPNARVKQKRTSTKKTKNSPSLKTHEFVKITPPATKKDLNKVTRIQDASSQKLLNAGGFGKPPSVSGASVVSSNDGSASEAASNLGTDSGYEDINSENSPTVKRVEERRFDDTCKSETSAQSSPICSSRKNYIDVEVMPCSMLLAQRSNSIIARRNSKRPDSEEDSILFLANATNYTRVTLDTASYDD